MVFRSRSFVLGTILSITLTAGAIDAGAQTVLRRGTATEPPTLDPNKAMAQSAAPMIDDMFLTLVDRNENVEFEPGAAESWTLSEDQITYTFKLREGLTWSDGVPVTAEDFDFSFRRFVDPKTRAVFASFLYPIKNARAINRGELPVENMGVKALDDLTLEVTLERPMPFFINIIANSTLAPVPRHAIEEWGDGWTKPGRMVSNGAYVLAERVPQSYIKLEKNPLFHEADQIQIDEIYYYPWKDLSTSLKQFRAGELDVVLNFPPNQFDWIQENIPDALQIAPSLAIFYIAINITKPPFDDVRVRKALSMVIDRELIANQLLRTGVSPAHTYVNPNFTGYDALRMPYQDLTFEERQEQARALLAEAGFDESNPLTLTYTYDPQEENRKMAVALLGMWKAIGVTVETDTLEFRQLINRFREGQFDIVRTAFFAAYDDPTSYLERFESGYVSNWVRYSNPAFDDLIAQSSVTLDADKRHEIQAQAERIFMDDYPIIPIYFHVWRRLVQPYVKGWINTPLSATPNRYLRIEHDEAG